MELLPLPRRVLFLAATLMAAIACCAHPGRAADAFGRAYAWGDNPYGQLADGGTLSRPVPHVVAGFPAGVAVVAASAGDKHALAVCSDGKVYAWGDNARGQLGDGTTASRPSPAPVLGLPDGVSITAVSAGGGHSLALGANGKVYAWGRNSSGQLGDGTNVSRSTPSPVASLPDGIPVTGIAAGRNHSLAVTSDGRVYAWGDNRSGQLGDKTSSSRTLPVLTAFVDSNRSVSVNAVAAGGDSSLAIGSESTFGSNLLYGWGSDDYGQATGSGRGKFAQYAPTLVSLTVGFTAISVGGRHALALNADGRLYAWGGDEVGQVGDGARPLRSPVVQVTPLPGGATVVGGAAGGSHSLARGSDGLLYAWGFNEYGQLGEQAVTVETSPVPVPGLPAGVTITSVSGGTDYSLAVGSDGKLYAWGRNDSGQLGVQTIASHDEPRVVTGLSLSGISVSTVVAGLSHSLALAGDGSVYAWGNNQFGQLGTGDLLERSAPTPVTGLPPGIPISAVAAGQYHSLALASNGTVYAWGRNDMGQTGDAADGMRPAPGRVEGFPDGVLMTAIAAGESHSLAVGSDGKVYAWGYNGFGQLGDGTTDTPTVPVGVTGLPNGISVTAVSAGADHSLALGSDGKVYGWGGNDEGQLGDGTNAARGVAAPVLGIPAFKTVTGISAGYYYSLARCSDGTLYGWGSNWTGQLGDGTAAEQATPTAVPAFAGGVHAVEASAGMWHTLAIGSDHAVYAWGDNRAGQLGDETMLTRIAPVLVSGFPAGSMAQAISAGADYSLSVQTGLPRPLGIDDARRAVEIAGGLTGATAGDMDRLDVANDGDSVGRIDISDAVGLLRKASGLEPNP
jgi:alpha-tubulin suppressor-like RCC1 family protein